MTSSRAFALYAWSVLGYNLAVILWGAFVRATGSGAGCGDHWPLCNGTAIPQSPQLGTIIEFTHRVTSGLAVALAVGLLILALRRFPAGHLARRAAAAAVFFEFMEALIGAALVLLGHVARNPSVARGYSLSVHLVNTLMLLAATTLTAWAASRQDGSPILGRAGLSRWKLAYAACAAALLLLGVSGAIAALGDTLFRSSSLSQAFRQDFSAAAHPFVRLRLWHPVIAVGSAMGIAALCYTVIARRISARAVGVAYLVLGLVAAQIAVGTINLSLLAPIPLQLAHLLLADLLWIAFVLMGAEAVFTTVPYNSAGTAPRPPELAVR